mgnify:FL=1
MNHYDSLTILSEEFLRVADGKGWYPDDSQYNLDRDLMHLHAEVSELWEADRVNSLNLPCNKSEFMVKYLKENLTCGEEEMADIVIKALTIAAKLKIDLPRAVRVTNDYNKIRPPKERK